VFIEEFDTNKDGRISWEEFVTTMNKLKEKLD
jgi:Ca2+-binding EF-hand superfamily protein